MLGGSLGTSTKNKPDTKDHELVEGHSTKSCLQILLDRFFEDLQSKEQTNSTREQM